MDAASKPLALVANAPIHGAYGNVHKSHWQVEDKLGMVGLHRCSTHRCAVAQSTLHYEHSTEDAAILGEAVFGRLCRSGARLFGRRYEVDAYEETRPDAFCSRCCGWGHIAPHCAVASPRCVACAKDHATNDHRCPVDGCKAGKGRPCPHGTTKCANCGGPHGSRRMPAWPRGRPEGPWQRRAF